MIRSILEKNREQLVFNKDKGDLFERLIRAFLKDDPQYAALYSDVWLWKDWPDRERLGYKLPDTGIDLVAKLRDEDGFSAIQCKFYETAISLTELGNFFTLSGKGGFVQRLIVATAPLTKNAADACEGQTIPVSLLTIEDLEASPFDWSQFSIELPEQLKKVTPKNPRPHQQEALEQVIEGFQKHDRGKLIMACGTGKTYASLLIAQEMVRPGGYVLFLVPSIGLLSQTLRAWTADSLTPLRCFAVCSDSKASRDAEDKRIFELAYPATTNAKKLAKSIKETHDASKMTVIFSTYQSIAVVHETQKQTGIKFDLIICDEAHRTTGYTPKGEDNSAFVSVHDSQYISGRYRLYMTATPRLYAESTKRKAKDAQIEVFSMDDAATYGPVFHRLRFDEAVKRDLLSDYKVLVIAVDEYYVNQALSGRISDAGDELKLDDAVKIVGCWNGLGKRLSEKDEVDLSIDPKPMRTAIAFAGSIKYSKLLSQEFERVSNDLNTEASDLPRLEAKHVDGTMNVVERNQKLSWLKDNIDGNEPVCRILTNARCLSEGIDLPALDTAIFLNPRDSVVDVVQSVGRVMRKADGKKYGYVILPIGIRKDASPETALDDNKKYRVVWQVLNALRAHDDRLDKQFATIDLTGKGNGVVQVIGVGGSGGDGSGQNGNLEQGALNLIIDLNDIHQWQDAIYGKIVHKCGNRRYWEDWAKDVAKIAEHHQMRIQAMLDKPTAEQNKAFDGFLEGLQKNINPSIDQNEAIEMLAQHIITRPVFEALFKDYAFTKLNPVSQAMQAIMDELDAQAFTKEQDVLEGFYSDVNERVSGIADPAGRQRIILELYDKFFKTAFPRMVERLGIVFTPVPIVDFIIKSADQALQEYFDCRLQDKGVHILDPFTGTGTFPVRLIESGLIPKAKLNDKFQHEFHANEIVLLAYYIAAINIEEAFHRTLGQDYAPFPGIVLTDTFQLNEWDEKLKVGIPANSERVMQQKKRDIRVIVSNPPYSVGQESGNDNNQNLKYPKLDKRIAETYAANSKAANKNSLYDSYIRAFRWASDRIKDEGIVCFVTNGGWIDGNAMDGFRKTLQSEFAAIYVFNLRGNARTQGELRRKEAGNVFDSGSRTPVAITLLVRKKGFKGQAKIFYHDIGDYLNRKEKLDIVGKFSSYKEIPWKEIHPNEHSDWINQRSDGFKKFIPFNDAANAIFAIRSNGVQTNRDSWVYNASRSELESNMKRTISFYNEQVDLHGAACLKAGKDAQKEAENRIDKDSRKIKWSGSLVADLCRGRKGTFSSEQIGIGIYRPFYKSWLYYDSLFNHRYKEKYYPTIHHTNLAISVTGTGLNKNFACLIVNVLPNLDLVPTGQCFPLHYYEKVDSREPRAALFEGFGFGDDYSKKDGVTDVALEDFRKQYQDDSISKEDIFYYCYAVLHAPEYREQYAADLKKELPRIPYAQDFWTFSKAGRELAYWHLNYETVDPWPVSEDRAPQKGLDSYTYYEVDKMSFASSGGREKDKSVIIYNDRITLKDIPLDAYNYVVNGKSAIEWIMECYAVSIDKDSGIRNDPNEWCKEHEDPEYILNLLKRVIRVSMESNRIVNGLPNPLQED